MVITDWLGDYLHRHHDSRIPTDLKGTGTTIEKGKEMKFCGWEIPIESVDREMIQAWHDALVEMKEKDGVEFPAYPQATGRLELSRGSLLDPGEELKPSGYCCLGVLCRVVMARKPGVLTATMRRGFDTLFMGEIDPTGTGATSTTTVLPYSAMKAAGFIMPYGEDDAQSYAAENHGRFENPPIIWVDQMQDGSKYRPISCAQANDSLHLSFFEIAEAIKRTYLDSWTDEMQTQNREYEEYWARIRRDIPRVPLLEPIPAEWPADDSEEIAV